MLKATILILLLIAGAYFKRVTFSLTKISKANKLLYDPETGEILSPSHLAKSITFDIINNQNLQYYGPLQIGSSKV